MADVMRGGDRRFLILRDRLTGALSATDLRGMTPEDVQDPPYFPVVVAQPDRHGGWVVRTCPFGCGRRHRHGGPPGVRVADCCPASYLVLHDTPRPAPRRRASTTSKEK